MTITQTRIVHTSPGCIKNEVVGKLRPWENEITLFTKLGQRNLLFLLLCPLFKIISCNNADRLIKIIKRSAICAGNCVLSDVIIMVTDVSVTSDETLLSTLSSVYDINMVVNTASVFFSFESWRKIFVAPFASCLSSQTKVSTHKQIQRVQRTRK